MDWTDQIAGVILGTAVGDALGLPREGLSRRRAKRWYGERGLSHGFFFGRGMVSDDTEHTCMVAQALLRAPDDPGVFARSLAWRLRFWLLGLPAGIGRATLRGILKLWLGFSPDRSGVYSAGNGPAMRSAILGVCLGGDEARLRAMTRAATRLTHTDPKAEHGALLVALAAHYGAQHGPEGIRGDQFLSAAVDSLADSDEELLGILRKLRQHWELGDPAVVVAEELGLYDGVTGYVYHTVPMSVYCWLRSAGNYRQAVEEVIGLGGDADTTGAIVGGIAGATVGASNIPAAWITGIVDWPRSVTWMSRLARRLAKQFSSGQEPVRAYGPLGLFWPAIPVRNLLFLIIVLLHIFRRLLPPY